MDPWKAIYPDPTRFRSHGPSNWARDERLANGEPDADPMDGGKKPRREF
jgi:hypothetical protein